MRIKYWFGGYAHMKKEQISYSEKRDGIRKTIAFDIDKYSNKSMVSMSN